LNTSLISRLQTQKKWQLWLAAIVLAVAMTLPIVAGMNFLLEGRVTANYLLTGLVASVAVAAVISGSIIYFLALFAQIQQDNQHLNGIIAACPIPIALNDDAHNIVLINPEFSRVFGFTQDDIPTLQAWCLKAYPDADYRQTVADAWQSRLDAMASNDGNFEPFEVKIRCKNADIKTVLATATPLEPAYKGLHLVVLYDITETARTSTELLESRNILQSIIETIPMRVFWKDLDSRYLGCNTAFAQDGGESEPADVIGKLDFELTWKDQADLYRLDDQQVMQANIHKLAYEEPQTTPSGQTIWLRTSKTPLRDNRANVIGVLGVYEDITDRKYIETQLRIAATAFESQESMVITDNETVILKVNHSFTELTGFTADEVIGQKMNILRSGIHDAGFYDDMWAAIAKTGYWQGEIWNRRKNGDTYTEWLTITAVKDHAGLITHYVGSMLDITSRKEIEEEVRHLAHFDILTDLPNRTLLTDRLQQALALVRREKAKLALMFLDLDRFKPVNDTLGHGIGDLLLAEVAKRLQTCIKRETDTVARLGGDEFVILLSRIDDAKEAAMVAENVVQTLNQPFKIEQHTINISTSLGVALYPTHGIDAKTLLKKADNAMYQAKEAGRSCFKFFQEPEKIDRRPRQSDCSASD
jgi:diguanylate cyclase (GGDEF)-like protein/PAS domain S-box-containing protein